MESSERTILLFPFEETIDKRLSIKSSFKIKSIFSAVEVRNFLTVHGKFCKVRDGGGLERARLRGRPFVVDMNAILDNITNTFYKIEHEYASQVYNSKFDVCVSFQLRSSLSWWKKSKTSSSSSIKYSVHVSSVYY